MHTSHQSTGAAKVKISHWYDSYLRCCKCTLVVSRSSRSSGVIRMIHHFLLIARLPPSLFSIRGGTTRFSTVSPWWEKLWIASIWEEVKIWMDEPHVLTAAPKFLRAYNIKSFSTLFADKIPWNFMISFPCARFISQLGYKLIAEM